MAVSSLLHTVHRSLSNQLTTTTTCFLSRYLPSSRLLSMSTHTDRTSHCTRYLEPVPCTVSHISNVSPSTKLLRLVADHEITFRAGQWLDFHIPNSNMIGGYSMCSAPGVSPIELAVKQSTHPPAKWIHTQCKIGDRVEVRIGGDVYMEEDGITKVVLLVAGGIGITPLISMIRAGVGSTTKYHLLYSAATAQELIFRTELEELAAFYDNIEVDFFVTRSIESPGKSVKSGRISPDIINSLVSRYSCKFGMNVVRCFLSGPPPMIDFMAKYVNIKCEYEKWW